MDFGKFITARRRGCIVGALHQMHQSGPGQSASSDLLHKYLLGIGLRPTLSQVHTDIEWLAAQQVLAISRIDDMVLVRITQTGIEVATRRQSIAGIDVSELEV